MSGNLPHAVRIAHHHAHLARSVTECERHPHSPPMPIPSPTPSKLRQEMLRDDYVSPVDHEGAQWMLARQQALDTQAVASSFLALMRRDLDDDDRNDESNDDDSEDDDNEDEDDEAIFYPYGRDAPSYSSCCAPAGAFSASLSATAKVDAFATFDFDGQAFMPARQAAQDDEMMFAMDL